MKAPPHVAACSQVSVNGRGNNCRPTGEHEAISGNRTCHFPKNNSPVETAAFAPGQLRDPVKVRDRGFFVELAALDCDKV